MLFEPAYLHRQFVPLTISCWYEDTGAGLGCAEAVQAPVPMSKYSQCKLREALLQESAGEENSGYGSRITQDCKNSASVL